MLPDIKQLILHHSPFHPYDRTYRGNPREDHYEFRLPKTCLEFFGSGLGEMMIFRQIGRALQRYVDEHGDPALGHVVIAAGAMTTAFHPVEGDLNLYWCYSFGEMDDQPDAFLSHYLDETSVEPDIILCTSERIQREATQLGYETVFFPFGVQGFRPLGLDREGMGYAGSEGHKSDEKVAWLMGPFSNQESFEWVSEFVLLEQLNLWYNTRLITFGLHKEGQREWGVVNSRVYETLASGTPLILERHPSVEDVLGFDYPYQVSSCDEAIALVEEIRSNPTEVLNEFCEYSERVRRMHSYENRLGTLFEQIL